MSNYEATRYDFDGENLQDVQGINTGLIIPWSSVATPSGFLDCDGSAVSRSTYSALFAVVGTNYGVGDGSTTFNLPDLTDRVCVHKSPTKTQFSTGGANANPLSAPVTLTVGNTTLSTPELPSHTHPTTGTVLTAPAENQASSTPGGRISGGTGTGSAGGDGGHNHPGSGNVGGNVDSLQPYLTIKYIIKT
jgi:microcystin-dependent protein